MISVDYSLYIIMTYTQDRYNLQTRGKTNDELSVVSLQIIIKGIMKHVSKFIRTQGR